MHKIPIYILVVLFPTLCRGQSTEEQQMMRLIRLYEQCQDSVFVTGNNIKRVLLLNQCAQQSEIILTELQSADSNTLQVSHFLHTAIHIYALSMQYNFDHDTASWKALWVLRPIVDQLDSTDFPMRFIVMKRPVVMRYHNIIPDLRLYYYVLSQGCNCKQFRAILPRLKYVEVAEKEWKKVHHEKCRKRKGLKS
jgi:hypothetical protein